MKVIVVNLQLSLLQQLDFIRKLIFTNNKKMTLEHIVTRKIESLSCYFSSNQNYSMETFELGTSLSIRFIDYYKTVKVCFDELYHVNCLLVKYEQKSVFRVLTIDDADNLFASLMDDIEDVTKYQSIYKLDRNCRILSETTVSMIFNFHQTIYELKQIVSR